MRKRRHKRAYVPRDRDHCTPRQAAKLIGVAYNQITKWIRTGQLPASRPGDSRYLIRKEIVLQAKRAPRTRGQRFRIPPQ